MPGGEVGGQALPESFTVGGADVAALLELDDASADLPVRGGEDGVDGLRGRVACSAEQLGDPGEDLVIARGYSAADGKAGVDRFLAIPLYITACSAKRGVCPK